MKKENFKILEVREQNPNANSNKAINGGGYHQPFITFSFNEITGYIDDSSCGEFGERFFVEFKGKEYSLDTMKRNNEEYEEYSSFSKKCLEDKILSKYLEEAGYPISFKEELNNY